MRARIICLTACLFMVLAVPAAEVAVYTPATTAPGMSPPPNTFEIFNPAKIPGRLDAPEPSFRAQFAYSGRDWEVYNEPPKPKRRPIDPTRYLRTVLVHRSVPAAMSISFERVETASDADPVTLAKILRYNREASAKFRLLSETNRSVDGVVGAQAEYVQLRKKKLMRVRHWTAHYNGIVYQLELVVPFEHPELMELGGTQGFPMLVNFSDHERNRPLLKDQEIPRGFASPYGYRVDLGEGEWIPYGHDPYISLAEYSAYTRNQGGIAVVPLSTLGEDLGAPALLDAVVWLSDLPTKEMVDRPRRVSGGGLQGITFDTISGDDEEMIRARAKAVCSSNHAYLAVAWINTNSPLGPEVLDQWLAKISFAPDAAPWPTNAQSLVGLLEKDRQGLGLYAVGQYYLTRKDFDRSAGALRMAMECRFLPQILTAFANSEYGRGHPEEIVTYLKSRGPIALRQGWVAMELALAESRCGDFEKAAAHYTQCIASGGYSAASFPPDCFQDYIRCLIKADRSGWARERLKQRVAVDPAPLWPKMLSELAVGPGVEPPSRPSTAGVAPAIASAAPAPTGPPRLKSIIWNPGKPSAQLDQNLAFEGDQVRGYKVVKILQNSVEILAPDGASLTLRKEP